MAAQAPQVDLGFAAPAFSLAATDGESYGLADLKGDKGTVVAFICNHCPYVVGMVDRLVRDARELAGLGVNTVAICSNDAVSYPEDAFPNMQAFALAHDFPFPYLHARPVRVRRRPQARLPRPPRRRPDRAAAARRQTRAARRHDACLENGKSPRRAGRIGRLFN